MLIFLLVEVFLFVESLLKSLVIIKKLGSALPS